MRQTEDVCTASGFAFVQVDHLDRDGDGNDDHLDLGEDGDDDDLDHDKDDGDVDEDGDISIQMSPSIRSGRMQ